MGKTLLHRFFGLERIPRRHFKAPGRRHSFRRSWFTGSLVMTEMRIAAFAHTRPIVNVTLDDPRIDELHCDLDGKGRLRLRWDPSVFDEKSSGSVECRFSIGSATLFLDRLRARQTTSI